MSVLIVGNGHIDVLVAALFEYGVVDPGTDRRELGQQLWAENVASVSFEWSEEIVPPAYQPHTTDAPLYPMAVVKAVHSYSYNACGHPDWKTSSARDLVNKLELAVVAKHPAQPWIYEKLPHLFERLDQALLSA